VTTARRRSWALVAYGVAAYLVFLALLFPYGDYVKRLAETHAPWPLDLAGVRVTPWGVSGASIRLRLPADGVVQAQNWSARPEWRTLWRGPFALHVELQILGGILDSRLVAAGDGVYPADAALQGVSVAALQDLVGPWVGSIPGRLRGTAGATWREDASGQRPHGQYAVTWRDAALIASASDATLRLGAVSVRGSLAVDHCSGNLASEGGDVAIHLGYEIHLSGDLADSSLKAEGQLRVTGELAQPWRQQLPLQRGVPLMFRLSGTVSAPRFAVVSGP
jgi:type II secretion system protein N